MLTIFFCRRLREFTVFKVIAEIFWFWDLRKRRMYKYPAGTTAKCRKTDEKHNYLRKRHFVVWCSYWWCGCTSRTDETMVALWAFHCNPRSWEEKMRGFTVSRYGISKVKMITSFSQKSFRLNLRSSSLEEQIKKSLRLSWWNTERKAVNVGSINVSLKCA